MSAKKLIERMAQQGTSSLSDAELLSLFLSTKDGVSALSQATVILEKVGGLAALFSRNDFGSVVVENMTDRQIALLQAGRVLASRASLCRVSNQNVLSSPEHVREFLRLHFQGRQDEVFGMVFLDNRHRVICYRDLFFGTIDSAAVYPRNCVKLALSMNCAAVILAHGHPSGVAEPSDTDVRLTRKLVDALSLIDVRVLDHLICGQGVYTSLAERGLM